ncbi:MAG: hypothetical protein U0R71_16170 [Solirubrobacterales bacterium]
MGVVPIVLVILAMKIPIFGLIWLVWWAARGEQSEGPAEEQVRDRRPLRPRPTPPGRPRRRGPHGGGAVAAAGPAACPGAAAGHRRGQLSARRKRRTREMTP